jgi:hypothetical protein
MTATPNALPIEIGPDVGTEVKWKQKVAPLCRLIATPGKYNFNVPSSRMRARSVRGRARGYTASVRDSSEKPHAGCGGHLRCSPFQRYLVCTSWPSLLPAFQHAFAGPKLHLSKRALLRHRLNVCGTLPILRQWHLTECPTAGEVCPSHLKVPAFPSAPAFGQ